MWAGAYTGHTRSVYIYRCMCQNAVYVCKRIISGMVIIARERVPGVSRLTVFTLRSVHRASTFVLT